MLVKYLNPFGHYTPVLTINAANLTSVLISTFNFWATLAFNVCVVHPAPDTSNFKFHKQLTSKVWALRGG